MIPRKLALRIWSDCCLAQADHLEDLATGVHDQPRRAAGRGRAASADKAPGRLARADKLRRLGRTLRVWAATPGRSRGGDLEPDLAGLVCAYLYRDPGAMPCIGIWLHHHGRDPRLGEGLDPRAFIGRLLEDS